MKAKDTQADFLRELEVASRLRDSGQPYMEQVNRAARMFEGVRRFYCNREYAEAHPFANREHLRYRYQHFFDPLDDSQQAMEESHDYLILLSVQYVLTKGYPADEKAKTLDSLLDAMQHMYTRFESRRRFWADDFELLINPKLKQVAA